MNPQVIVVYECVLVWSADVLRYSVIEQQICML